MGQGCNVQPQLFRTGERLHFAQSRGIIATNVESKSRNEGEGAVGNRPN